MDTQPPLHEPLTPPAPVAPVPTTRTGEFVQLDPETTRRLDVRAQEFIDAIVMADLRSESFQDKLKAVQNMGSAEIRDAASVSNRLLDRPVKAMEGGLFDDKSPISRSLIDLRRTVEDLDPAAQGNLLAPRKLLGLIPFGNKLREYFQRYQSAQSHLNAILNSLYSGQDELRKDNAAIEQEKQTLWALMLRLREYAHMGKSMDAALEARLAELDASIPEKARVVREELLFYVRQKVQDLLTQLAVAIQGYLAMDMIRKNNLELIKGVDRATTTTVSALRTAVMVAQALANQRLVLDQINALNTTTGNLIESTSALLRSQSAQVHEQAADSTLQIEKLRAAFQNIYATMDMVADYKIKALERMRTTVDALSGEVTKAHAYLDRVRSQEAAGAVGTEIAKGHDQGELRL
jgi:uncharacterized protein YaaN involved in tellurite resistance